MIIPRINITFEHSMEPSAIYMTYYYYYYKYADAAEIDTGMRILMQGDMMFYTFMHSPSFKGQEW